MVSLGCAKNSVDSERILGTLAESGFAVAADPSWADVVLVNTCAFIAPAREETEETLCSFGRDASVVALGCYAERFRGERAEAVFRLDDFPAVEAFVAFDAYDRLPSIIAGILAQRRRELPTAGPEDAPCARGDLRVEAPALPFECAPRLRLGSSASAYLKIAEGCSTRCRYCAVPDIRGPLRSFPVERLVEEAAQLAGLGAKEICVIAQDTGAYGTDLYGEPRTAALLRALCRVDGVEWIRLLYVHPLRLTDEIIDAVADEEKVCKYLDVPMQHASDHILRAMGRGHDGALLRALVDGVRRRAPGVALRTSIITGFPGETDEDFRELMDFVRRARFDHLGAFVYSPEDRTEAAALPDRPAVETAVERRGILMEEQQRMAFSILDARVGGTGTAMLEFCPSEGEGLWLARTAREAPEVDGCVLARMPKKARPRPGRLVRVEIVGRSGYDLQARPATGSSPGRSIARERGRA